MMDRDIKKAILKIKLEHALRLGAFRERDKREVSEKSTKHNAKVEREKVNAEQGLTI